MNPFCVLGSFFVVLLYQLFTYIDEEENSILEFNYVSRNHFGFLTLFIASHLVSRVDVLLDHVG